ncbi:hypothetical protein [Arenibaculum sp.]|jgi:uncharacterized protein YndB with AHSA1/START domain|uniref:hypothetical protein n=1 Tax=Arenibaculum sp. TaxID=2865862 RepID=UPI002E107DF2|nr:hypothetical protein [Arenibaculum sp.]
MSDNSFSTSFTVAQPPEAVFAAINDVRGWWSDGIEGQADRIGGRPMTDGGQALVRAKGAGL